MHSEMRVEAAAEVADDDVIVIEDISSPGEPGGEQADRAGWLEDLDLPDEFWDEVATEPARTTLQVYAGEEAKGFDLALGHNWIYPTNCELRQYQYDIVEQALFHNTLVSLPTGLGKTLIAAVVMFNFYRWYPTGKVLFLAPSKPLVAQQIESCYKVMGIPAQDTAELTGHLRADQRDALWRERRVFFATPQVVTNDLARGGCKAEAVRCVVVDEAHRALGEHAYCQVIRMLDMFNKQYRVLALSATPGSDLEAVRQVVRNLRISRVELRSEESPDVKPYVHQRNVELSVVPLDRRILRLRDQLLDLVDNHMKKLRARGVMSVHSSLLSKFKLIKLREHWRRTRAHLLDKQTRGYVEADFMAGMSLCHALDLLCGHGVQTFLSCLNGLVEKSGPHRDSSGKLQALLDEARRLTGPTCIDNQDQQEALCEAHSHPKLEKLEKVVLDHFQAYQRSGTETRVIVFAQYRDSVLEICQLLQKHQPLIKPMQFIGQLRQGKGGFTQKQQMEVVSQFCNGGYNTLVSTCVGEEGLDIGEVDLIVCFDTSNCVRMKQRMGRTGRKREGRIVMLLTEGKEYKKYMQSVQQTRTISRHLLQLGNLKSHLCQHSPRMVPPGVTPQCCKMFMTIKEKRSSEKGKGKQKADMRKYLATMASPYLSSEELAQLKPEPMLSFDRLRCFQPGKPGVEADEEDGELSSWVDWQLELQPTFTGEHSRHSEVLVELLQRACAADLPASQACHVASQMAPRPKVRRKPGPRASRLKTANAELPLQGSNAALVSSASSPPVPAKSGIKNFLKPKPVRSKGKDSGQRTNMRITELITQTARTEEDKIIENIFKDFRHKLQVFKEEWRSVGGLATVCNMPSLKAVLKVRKRPRKSKDIGILNTSSIDNLNTSNIGNLNTSNIDNLNTSNIDNLNTSIVDVSVSEEEMSKTVLKKKAGKLQLSLKKESSGISTYITGRSVAEKAIYTKLTVAKVTGSSAVEKTISTDLTAAGESISTDLTTAKPTASSTAQKIICIDLTADKLNGSSSAVKTFYRDLEKMGKSEVLECSRNQAAVCEKLQRNVCDNSSEEKQQDQDDFPLHFDLSFSDWCDDDRSVEIVLSPERCLETGVKAVASPPPDTCVLGLSPILRHSFNSSLLLTPPRDSGRKEERSGNNFTRPAPPTSPILGSFPSNLPNVAASTPKLSRKNPEMQQLQFDMFDVDDLMKEFEEEAMVGEMDELRDDFRADVGEGSSALSAKQFCRMLRDPTSELYAVSPEVRRQMQVIYKGVGEPWQFGTRVTKVNETRELRWWQKVLQEREARQESAHTPCKEDGQLDLSFLERSWDAETIADAKHRQSTELLRAKRRLSLVPGGAVEPSSDDSVVVHPAKRRKHAVRLNLSDKSLGEVSVQTVVHTNKHKGPDPRQFLDTEADVSAQQLVSSDEDTSGLDSYDSSFVDDSVTDVASELQAKYLHSVIRSPAVSRLKSFRRPLPRKCDILSQVDVSSDSSYENDSFCVEEADKSQMSEMCPLELAEAALERNRRRKRSHHATSTPKAKRRRIIGGLEEDSSDEGHSSVLREGVARSEEERRTCETVTCDDPRTRITESESYIDRDFCKPKTGAEQWRHLKKINPSVQLGVCKITGGESEGKCRQIASEVAPRAHLKSVDSEKSSKKDAADLKTVALSDTSGTGSINFDFLAEDLFEDEFEVPDDNHVTVGRLPDPEVNAGVSRLLQFGHPSDLPGVAPLPQGNTTVTVGRAVMLVGSGQNCLATRVTAVLRATHGIDTRVVPAKEAHYIISRRIGVLRLCTANLSRPSYKQVLEEAVLLLRAHFPRPVVILEDGRPTGGAAVAWSRLAIGRLAGLLRARLRLLFSATQDNTADLLALLARREQEEGHAIAPFQDQELHSEVFQFISTLPGINFACALQLTQKFPRITDFLQCCSSLDKLREVTGLSRSCASRVHLILSGVIQPPHPRRPAPGPGSSVRPLLPR